MMEWIKERHDFISKMSEDPQMSKLFVLVMLTNDLRQLEKIQSRLVRSWSVMIHIKRKPLPCEMWSAKCPLCWRSDQFYPGVPAIFSQTLK